MAPYHSSSSHPLFLRHIIIYIMWYSVFFWTIYLVGIELNLTFDPSPYFTFFVLYTCELIYWTGIFRVGSIIHFHMFLFIRFSEQPYSRVMYIHAQGATIQIHVFVFYTHIIEYFLNDIICIKWILRSSNCYCQSYTYNQVVNFVIY